MSGYLNWDALGMTRTKASHPLFAVNVTSYQAAIDWLKVRIARASGLLAACAVLDPAAQQWRFYDAENNFLVSVPHDLVDRVMTAQVWSEHDAA